MCRDVNVKPRAMWPNAIIVFGDPYQMPTSSGFMI